MSASTFSRSSKELMNRDAKTPADLTCDATEASIRLPAKKVLAIRWSFVADH